MSGIAVGVPNAQYNVARPGSLPVRVATHQRRRMFQAFLDATRIESADTILDVGATSDQGYAHSNYFEAWYPHKTRITAAGVDDASFLEQRYPGLRFVLADGRDLPFADGAFDYVHSSAVLEHVGSRDKQARFLGEMWRVARKGIFATTPNRWFPVEFHTVLPIVHWLPPAAFRVLLRQIGRGFFADEENLNLLTRRVLLRCAEQAGIRRPRVDHVSLAFW
ncbi:MAG: class I SAM-dependent methyltransferase, partial [Acetobacteraceae bacterium]|nr:class I SAM-dependent methyltransferase [Acetobacteraceae bacterium]